ncbi:hypothetical protein GCM10007216_08920 [Thalassobacillus devorans]|uniref:DUF3397 domain-containing protein n=1 Tax=Thalassobacillus devorans TaxID=279813 RepID=A0ABQ1NR95_9BACI|nr:DUF3397 domain-containing protein [Thalassobacillus devorans]NIK27803.1 hypothetical protein [Thalassobacillus devorans]GGC80565.1 hypothetical protein GCM10007216_08920 [Thalassobacillus devorans]
MSNFFIYMYAAAITMPIPILLIFYFIYRKIYRHKWKAIHKTTNLATLLFILSVDLLAKVLFEQSFFGYILLVLLLVLTGAIIIQYRLHEEIVFKRAWKGFWRFNTLLFGFLYISLSLYGLAGKLLAL